MSHPALAKPPRILVAVIEAALDQPSPTSALKDALQVYLLFTDHPDRLQLEGPKRD